MDSKYETSPTFREFMEYLVDLPLGDLVLVRELRLLPVSREV